MARSSDARRVRHISIPAIHQPERTVSGPTPSDFRGFYSLDAEIAPRWAKILRKACRSLINFRRCTPEERMRENWLIESVIIKFTWEFLNWIELKWVKFTWEFLNWIIKFTFTNWIELKWRRKLIWAFLRSCFWYTLFPGFSSVNRRPDIFWDYLHLPSRVKPFTNTYNTTYCPMLWKWF